MRVKDKYINPFTDFGFKKFFEQAEIANFNDEEYNEYEESLKSYRDLKNSLDTAREEGIEEGIMQGMEQGIEQGRVKGKTETATALKKLGIAIEVISKSTGLSEEEIEKL